jgi:hypothetical protein
MGKDGDVPETLSVEDLRLRCYHITRIKHMDIKRIFQDEMV